MRKCGSGDDLLFSTGRRFVEKFDQKFVKEKQFVKSLSQGHSQLLPALAVVLVSPELT